MSQASSADGPPTGSRSCENRRRFISGSSLLLAGALPGGGFAGAAQAAVGSVGSNQAASLVVRLAPSTASCEIRVGLVGCGKRGMAVVNLLLAASDPHRQVQLTALADPFADRMQQTLRGLKSKYPQQIAVDGRTRCSGLDGYRRLLDSDVDLVILATPPSFRPQHFEAAVAAGKHVYAEKPIAVDPSGVSRFHNANRHALEQRLVVGVGFPRRFEAQYRATVERLRTGAIGHIVSAQAVQTVRQGVAHWQSTSNRTVPTEQEAQLRNWTAHAWASGGPWVEPHVQNLDVINWLLGAHPLHARPAVLETDDSRLRHVPAVDFEYPHGVVLTSHCRMIEASQPSRLILTVQGTSGSCDLAKGKIFDCNGRLVWRVGAEKPSVEFPQNMLASIALGSGFNQGEEAMEATLTALLGRTVSMRGQPVDWQELLV